MAMNRITLVSMLSMTLAWGGLASCATTRQVSSGNTDQCLNVEWHGFPVAGTPLRVKPCDPWRNQQWFFNKDGSITGVGGFCLDTKNSGVAAGTPVLYVPCVGSPTQKWTVNGTQLIASGGMCVDIAGGEPDPLAPVVLETCNGAPSQQWSLH
jgi:ricin-type beta-trefoil lectin protein